MWHNACFSGLQLAGPCRKDHLERVYGMEVVYVWHMVFEGSCFTETG